MYRLKWLLPLALALFACPGPIDVPDGGDGIEIIVPAGKGGTFIREACSLIVPEGAFAEETRIFVTRTEMGLTDPPMRKRISHGCRMSPSTLKPSAPLTIFMTWDAGAVPAGVSPDSFDLRRQFGGEAYTALPGVRVNLASDLNPVANLEAKTDKPGLFWVTSPSEPNIERLELTPEEASLRVGDTQQFTARVVSPTGETIDTPITWRVAPPRVGSLDDAGVFTALDPGIATITVSAGMQSATAKVYVQGNPTGPVTFAHENPFPTGNDLYGGAFGPAGLGTVYAGGNGTVLVEDALGAWTRVSSIPSVTLKAVGGSSLENAAAVGQANGLGVLVEFHGAQPPTARTFTATQITDLSQLWFDGTHGMGAGTGNELVIYRGGQWETEYHPSFEEILSVIGDGAGGFTVVGDLGSIYQWDPTRRVWDSLYDTRLAVKLDAAKLIDFSTGEAWAVGGNRLWHFMGTGWVSEGLPATPALLRGTTVGVAGGRVIIGGELQLPTTGLLPNGKGLVLVRSEEVPSDGGAPGPVWTSAILRGQQIPLGFMSEGVTARLVGTLGAVWKYDATTDAWTETSSGFQGDVSDVAATATDTFAAVNECVDIRCTTKRGVVMHRGANGYEALGSLPTLQQVHALVARADNEVIVTTDTTIFAWNGTGWNTVPLGTAAGAVLDLMWCGNDLWGAGEGGTVYRGNAFGIDNMGGVGNATLNSIFCRNNELWVAGTGFMATRPASGGWVLRQSPDFTHGDWKAAWSPGPGEGFAFGDAQFGAYWDTTQLLESRPGPVGMDVAEAMWGDKIDNLYMTGITVTPGIFGFMLRYDGINWQLVDSGAHRRGTALFGLGGNQIWVGTEGGGVLKAVAP